MPREGLLLELAELPVRLAVSMDGRRLSFLLILFTPGSAMVLCRRVKCSLPPGPRKLSTEGDRFDDDLLRKLSILGDRRGGGGGGAMPGTLALTDALRVILGLLCMLRPRVNRPRLG